MLPQRRAYSTSQIADHEPFRKVPTASDPSSALIKNPLRKAQFQDLSQLSPEPQFWQGDFQVSLICVHLLESKAKGKRVEAAVWRSKRDNSSYTP